MKERETLFAKKIFSKYYRQRKNEIKHPERVNMREFGFTFFGREGMHRHVAFSSLEEFRGFLEMNSPSNSMYSSAYFENPENREMNRKKWLSADLIFDIDADHLPGVKEDRTTTWSCRKCGERGIGEKIKCPSCESIEIDKVKWPNKESLRNARKVAEKLIFDFLIEDFGVEEEEILIKFSGQRGYHIHVHKEKTLKLTQEERREIINYLKGQGWSYEKWFEKREGKIIGPGIYDAGWRGRVAKGFIRLLIHAKEKLGKELNFLSPRKIEELKKKRKEILRNLSRETGIWSNREINLSKTQIMKIVQHIIEENTCQIDEAVTLDIKRLIRTPNTLHGKTGFIAKTIELENLRKFEPLNKAILNYDFNVKIKTRVIPKMEIGKESFGPFENEEVEVPVYLALLAVLKGGADLIGDHRNPFKDP